MRLCIALSVLALAGCDKLFSLSHVDLPPDAAPDGSGSADAGGCGATTMHDEDGDTLTDDCDACPTVPSGDTDTDVDGLTDACDPDLSKSVDGDRIILASTFRSTADLAAYDPGGTAAAAVSADMLDLPAGAQIRTKTTNLPTLIVVDVATFGGSQTSENFEVGQNGAQCLIAPSGCAGEANQICVKFKLSAVTKNVPASTIRQIRMQSDAAGVHCSIVSTSGTDVITDVGAFTSSLSYVQTSGLHVQLNNLVIYGEK